MIVDFQWLVLRLADKRVNSCVCLTRKFLLMFLPTCIELGAYTLFMLNIVFIQAADLF